MVFFFILSGVAATLIYKGFLKTALVLAIILLLLGCWNFICHITASLEMRW